MKKSLIVITSVAMIAGVVSFSSCKKEDTTAPVITVTGGNAQSQSLPTTAGAGTYTNPTATATDDEDGDLSTSVTVSGTVDANNKGTYTLTYSVTDAAGNTATQDVVVDIVNDAEAFAGNYSVHDTVPTLAAFLYNQTISTDAAVNNKIHFTHTDGFAFYSNNLNIYATVGGTTAGSTVSLPMQVANNIGSPAENHDFTGTGSVITASPMKFNITYTDHNITQAATASGCVMTLTHN